MRQLGLFATAFLVLCLAACSGKKDDKKDDKDGAKDSGKGKTNEEKIVGKWEVTKSSSGTPLGSVFEFTKDGKMIVSIKDKDKLIPAPEGTYKVEGDTLTSASKDMPDRKETVKIKELSDTKLILEDKGKTEELTKK